MDRMKKDTVLAAGSIAASKGCGSSSSSSSSDRLPPSFNVNKLVQDAASRSSSRPNSKLTNNGRRNYASTSSSHNSSLKPEAGNSNRRCNKTKNRDGGNFYEKKQKGKQGAASGSLHCPHIDIWDGDLMGAEESGASSTRFRGTKKHNLNHLLNFSFSQRDDHVYDPGFYLTYDDEWRYGHSPGESQRRSLGISRARRAPVRHYSKEQFLQANCQFVVSNLGSYAKQEADPDAPVPWEDIEEIRCFNSTNDGETSCPICLDAPVAAKITRCGHVFCWSCVLHYLALSDNECRKCPICFYPISKSELKSVSFLVRLSVKVGDVITFKLMVRKKDSTVAMPVDDFRKLKQKALRFGRMSLNSDDDCFKKLVIASQDQIMSSVIDRERKELKSQYDLEKDSPEVCFIDVAFEELEKRETSAKFIGCTEPKPNNCESKSNNQSQVKRHPSLSAGSASEHELSKGEDQAASPPPQDSHKGQSVENKSNNEAEHKESEIESPKTDDNQQERPSNESSRRQKKPPKKTGSFEEEYVYFYQASDGQQIYLHNLNIKMLNRQYGSLEFAPTDITAKLIGLQYGSVTEKLRRRYPHIGHLPLSCQFRVAELAFEEPLVSKETLDEFRDKLEKREKRRQRRAQEEKEREKMFNEEEKKFYRSLGVRPQRPRRSRRDTDGEIRDVEENDSDEDEDDHRSTSGSSSASYDMHLEDFPLPSSSPGTNDCAEEGIFVNAAANDNDLEMDGNRMSFATMLRDGKRTSGPSTSAVGSTRGAAPEDTHDEHSPPQFNYSLSDAFEAALTVQKNKRGKERRKKK